MRTGKHGPWAARVQPAPSSRHAWPIILFSTGSQAEGDVCNECHGTINRPWTTFTYSQRNAPYNQFNKGRSRLLLCPPRLESFCTPRRSAGPPSAIVPQLATFTYSQRNPPPIPYNQFTQGHSRLLSCPPRLESFCTHRRSAGPPSAILPQLATSIPKR